MQLTALRAAPDAERWTAPRGEKATRVAIDSNALTYLIEAMSPAYDPAQDRTGLAADRVAMIRIRFYAGVPLSVLPTVEREYQAIHQDAKREGHVRTCALFLDEGPWNLDQRSVEARANVLSASHSGGRDCLIVAEAEGAGMTALLTCDDKLVSALSPYSAVPLLRPLSFFASLGIAPDAKPVWTPAPGNPIGDRGWWRL